MRLILDNKVYEKVMHCVDSSNLEIGGLGLVKIEGDSVYVTEFFLLEQDVTSTTTQIRAEALSKLLYQTRDNTNGELLWWWHSHVDMGVFWSDTDMKTIREFGEEGRFFATVFNKDREMKSAYFQAGTDQYPELFIDDIETLAQSGLSVEESEALDEEIAAKVFVKTYYPTTATYPKYSYLTEEEEEELLLQDWYQQTEEWEQKKIGARNARIPN